MLVVLLCVFLSGIARVDAALAETIGTEFLIGLLQQASPDTTSLFISSNVATSVTLEAPFIGLSKTYFVPAGGKRIELDRALRETGEAISFKGIHVKATDPISIHVIDSAEPNMGGFTALPIQALSNEYMIISHSSNTSSEFLIMSKSDRNRVSVTLSTKGNVTHNGLVYTHGEVIHEILDTFQTWQISSNMDLTGSYVKAEGEVAVLSGSKCTHIPQNMATCDFLDEQMTPVTSWETSFIVPLINACANVVRVLARDDGTTVTLKHGQTKAVVHLDSTDFVDKSYPVEDQRNPVVVVQATRPVLIAHLTGGNNTNQNCGPSMTLIPAINQMTSTYNLMGIGNLTASSVKIIIREDKMAGLRMNNQSITPINRYGVLIGRLKDSMAVFDIVLPQTYSNNTPITISHITGVKFGAIFYGFHQNQGLSFTIGMRMDLSEANDVVRLVNGSSQTSGRVEVFHQGNWGTICDSNFGGTEADVICRMIGYYFGSPNAIVHSKAYYGEGSGTVMIENLKCGGTELDLHLCQSSPWEQSHCQHNQDVGVDCASKVRLTGTSDPREGRLEIFYNDQWGAVCDDNFNRKAAAVVCASLGFGNAGYVYTGVRSTSVTQWIDDVECSGSEDDIAQCMTKSWGRTDCGRQEDVSVACYPTTRIRLTSGNTPAEGRLEVYAQSNWHTVCDNRFDVKDAAVVCSMLGYNRRGTAVNVYKGAHYGQGTGNIIIDELECTGSENDIADCQSRPWMTQTSCTHSHDVGVRCGSSVRIVNGPSPTSGRLEVFYKGHWGTVCDRTFDRQDAKVACTQLGYPHGAEGLDPVRRNATYGSGTGEVVIDDISCHGDESDIALCRSRPWLNTRCIHDQDVGIDCGSSVRLVGGSSPTEGRVEVFYQGRWGTVCSDRFDTRSADVICDQLGFNFNLPRKVYRGAHFGRGTGDIVIDELQCSGSESDIQFCISSPWLTHDCTHAQDVGIDCGLRLPDAINASCSAGGWQIQVDMRRLQRVFPGSIPSDIILGKETCKGNLHGDLLTFRYGFHANSCGTKVTYLSTSNVYTNKLTYEFHDPLHPQIIRNYNWTVTLNCELLRNGSFVVDVNPSVKNESTGTIGSTTKYTVQQTFYSDAGFTHQLASHPLQVAVNAETYVKVFTSDADGSEKMILKSCNATSSSNPNVGQSLPLIRNSCEVDPSVHILSLANHETRFKFRVFAFDNNNQGLFIHCETKFCGVLDFSPECQQRCVH